MRVGIDGGCWSNRRGFGRFLRELMNALAEECRHDYTILLEGSGYRSFPHRDRLHAVLVKTSLPVDEAAGADSHRPLGDLLRMGAAARKLPVDVFFYPAVYSYFPLPRRIPVLLGVHDTMADRFPEMAFQSPRQQRFWNWKVRVALWQASAILTVSEYSARSIHERHGVPREKIHVLYEAPASLFQPMDLGPPPEPYILAVGGLSPNKNLETLLHAFAPVAAHRPDCRLVLAGDYESDHFKSSYATLLQLVAELGLKDRVQFTGFVTDEQLARLYNQASVLTFPSLEEGFGLPAVEAMACGLPVIASNAHALAEIVGDAGLLVDPRNTTAWSAAILEVLRNPAFSAELRGRSLARSARFSWKAAARRLELILDEIGKPGEA